MKKMIIKNMMAAASVALVMGGSLTACVDLDLSPNNAPSEGNVWNSASMAEQTIAGVYNRLYEDYTADPNKGWFDMWSSIMDIDANWTAGYHFLHANNTPTSDFGSERWWKNYYSGILRANDVITNLPTVAGISEAKKSRYVSECKFLRSWWYYRLNILYGGVPYYTEPVKSIDGAKKARSTQDEIWDYLIQDLTSCIDDPNLPNKYGADSEDYGHVTKGAAYALRGKVYMWKKEWKKAADDFEEVSKCGYKLYTNGSDAYKQLFKAANERCDEMIFSLQCINEEGFGGIKNRGYGNRCLPPDNEGKGLGWNNYVINPQFVDSYENKDGSPFNWDDIIPGYSAMSTNARQVYFLRNEINATERANAEASGADMTQYKNSGNEERIKAAYANRDPRLGFSVITPYSTFIGGIFGAAHTDPYGLDYYTASVPSMGAQLEERYGGDILCRDLRGENLPEKTTLSVAGTEFEAIYYGETPLRNMGLIRSCQVWRLVDAYDTFSQWEASGDNRPGNTYPMTVRAGEAYAIHYHCWDGTDFWWYGVCEGMRLENGALNTAEVIPPEAEREGMDNG